MSTRKRKFTWLNALTTLIIIVIILGWCFLLAGQFMIHIFPRFSHK